MKNQYPIFMQMMCFGQNDNFSLVNTIPYPAYVLLWDI